MSFGIRGNCVTRECDAQPQPKETNDERDEPDDLDVGHDLEITKTTRRASGGGTWVCGTLSGHRFDALVFPEHADNPEWEIGDSRISKLLDSAAGRQARRSSIGIAGRTCRPRTTWSPASSISWRAGSPTTSTAKPKRACTRVAAGGSRRLTMAAIPFHVNRGVRSCPRRPDQDREDDARPPRRRRPSRPSQIQKDAKGRFWIVPKDGGARAWTVRHEEGERLDAKCERAARQGRRRPNEGEEGQGAEGEEAQRHRRGGAGPGRQRRSR